MKNFYSLLILTLILTGSILFAGDWHPVYEGGAPDAITAVAAGNGDFRTQIAVGEQGNIYRSFDGGRYWELMNSGVAENLTDVISFYGDTSNVFLAVGENGTILRSDNYGNYWEYTQLTDTSGAGENFYAAAYDESQGRVWIAGANGAVYTSYDFGRNWTYVPIENANLSILDMVWDYDGLFVVGFKNDTSFVHKIDDSTGPPYVKFAPGDTIPGVTLSSLYYSPGQLFIAGSNQAGDAFIYYRFYSNSLGPNALMKNFPQLNITDMDVYQISYPDSVQIIWLTTEQGEIWESRDGGITFNVRYKDPLSRPLYNILTDKTGFFELGQAVATGANELILKYSFELLDYKLHPNKNDNLSSPIYRIEMGFSAVPALFSINQYVSITSSLSGNIPFWTEYDTNDSTVVFLNISRSFPPESIPGEKWNISIGDSIQQLNDDGLPSSIFAFNYDVQFMPYSQGSLSFKKSTIQNLLQKPMTNIVTGFFNNDDIFDLATFDGDTLYVFEIDASGVITNFQGFPFNIGRNIVPAIKDQLVLADLNNDGRQDIVFYDNTIITSFINQSIDANYNFTYSGHNYGTFNLKQVQFFNGDNNSQPDMVILNDSLLCRMNISENSFGQPGAVLEAAGAINERIKVADLDVDGQADIISVNNDGSVSFYRALSEGSFDFPSKYVAGGVYRDVYVADLDQDKRLDVIALKDQDLDLYSLNPTDNRSLMPVTTLSQQIPDSIEDVAVHDFGGATNDFGEPSQIDIAIVTSDSSLKIFENRTAQDGIISFLERDDKRVSLDIVANGIIHWDGNADANLDIMAFNRYNGNFQNVINKSWAPVITSITAETQGVRINWNSFPTELGNFEYYRLYKEYWDRDFQNSRTWDFSNVSDTTFLDTETRPLEQYTYRIEIHYDGQVKSDPIPTTIALGTHIGGPVTGVLADTINGYIVDRDINVPSGQSLLIEKGVQIGFTPGTIFNVSGSLAIKGTLMQMTEFRPYSQDSTFGTWRGVRLNPGSDTVDFEWFSIGGADTAIATLNRPLKMSKGGISRGIRGILAVGSDLILENVLIDSNNIGLILDNSTADLKNLNIMSNAQLGLNVKQGSDVKARNSILWNNGLFDANVNSAASLEVNYSTLGTVNGVFSGLELNRLIDPQFLNINAENDSNFYYQPTPLSPTVDAGDPSDDYSLEPMPNGGRINQGLLGGLQLATRSLRPKLVITPDPILMTAKLGESDTVHLTIRNNGATQLNTSVIDVAGFKDIFSFVLPPEITLSPGASTQYAIIFNPKERRDYIDTLLITSNDPARPVLKTPIVGSVPNWLPQVQETPATMAPVGKEYSYRILPIDKDDNTVTITVTQKPSWLPQIAADEFKGTPTVEDIGVDTLSFQLTDAFGETQSFMFTITVYQDDLSPVFEHIADTTIYTNVQFYYQWKVYDPDNGLLTFSDNTSLFDIQPDSGIIIFTPQVGDTGISEIVVSATDGVHTIQDTFNLKILINVLNAAQNLVLTPQDQAIDISFTTPVNDLITSTMVRISSTNSVLSPNRGTLVKDTVLTEGSQAQFRISGLKINTTYNVAVFNYYSVQAKDAIFSTPLLGTVTTLAPAVKLAGTSNVVDLPVNQEMEGQILLKNTGGGTLIGRFDYIPDSLVNVWFDLDTSQHTIAPSDSIFINYTLHPNKHLSEDLIYSVTTTLQSNDPTDAVYSFTITMIPIFDKFKPDIVVTARPDSIVKQAAFTIHFYGDDLTGRPIGDPQDSLYYYYRLYKGLTNPVLLESGDSVRTNSFTFYRLDDGLYRLRLWASDTEGNQKLAANRKNIYFYVDATTRRILRKRWQMVSIPRPVEVTWKNYVVDSLLQIYRWDNEEDRYKSVLSYPDQKYNMGEAVWIISANTFPVNVSGEQASLDSIYTTAVVKGWNQIGTPIAYVTGWGDMTFTPTGGQQMSLSNAAKNNLVSPVVYWYESTNEDYGWQDIANAVAVPWRGYWLKAEVPGIIGYSTTAVDTFRNVVSPDAFAKTSNDVNFNITLKTNESSDRYNVFGIADDGTLKDVLEPPQIGSRSTFYFWEGNNRLTRRMQSGFTSLADVKSWEAVVESPSGNQLHTLSWDAEKMASSGNYFFMVDTKKEILIEMNQESSYSFKTADSKTNLTIYATQDASFRPKIVPVAFRLVQNYPNPFNPSTTIRFGVPENMQDHKVKIKIYNVLGQEITELFNKVFEAGYHEVNWNGQNSYGHPVASGVYFYKLVSGNSTLARKMVLIR